MPPSTTDILHAYRHLYRGLLYAVQFSKPARYAARDQLRRAFRKEDPATFSQEKIDKTLIFLQLAAATPGLERKILKNLLRTCFSREFLKKRMGNIIMKERITGARVNDGGHIGKTSMVHYDMTVAMLNDTMGLCLR